MMQGVNPLHPGLTAEPFPEDEDVARGFERCLCCWYIVSSREIMRDVCADRSDVCVQCFLRAELGAPASEA